MIDGRRIRRGAACVLLAAMAASCGADDATSDTSAAATEAATAPTTPAVGSTDPATTQPAGAVADNDETAVLRVIGTNAPQLADPVRGISRCDGPQLAPLYDTLVRVDPQGKLVPGLASEWSAPDPLTFDLTLQQGVVFQDQTPFDADAVKAHFERAKSDPESAMTETAALIESVDVVDATHLVLHLSAPRAGILPSLLTDRLGMVPSPTSIEQVGSSEYGATAAVGAGPYRYVSSIPNESLVLERWDGYWDPSTQLLGGIEFMGAASEFQTERIVSGEVDYATLKDSDLAIVQKAADAGDVDYLLSPSNQYAHIFVNFAKAPYDDLRVRQALEYGLDRDLLNETLTNGAGTVARGPLSPTNWGHNPDVDDLYPFDPAKARELLTEAGYPDGITMKMASIQNPYYERIALAVQDMLKESGITIELTPVAGAEIQNALYVRQDFDAAISGWAGNSDPGIGMEQRWSSTGANNPAKVAGEGIDELLAKGAATTDQEERAEAYREAELSIMQQALEIPIFFTSGLTVFDPSVKNVGAGYTGCDNNFLVPPTYIEG